jgi:formylglycine-generating enzyme required for sulfatase activity
MKRLGRKRGGQCLAVFAGLFILLAIPTAAHAVVDQLINWVNGQFRDSKTHVVVIGINKYENIGSLNYAVNDANSIINLFEGLGHTIAKDSRLLRDTISPDTHISRRRIRTTIRRTLRNAAADDRVIIFYSGHGQVKKDRFGRQGKAYLLPSDYDPNDISGTALAFQDLIDLASEEGVDAKHIMFILDACYAADALNMDNARDPVEVDDPYIQHIIESPGIVAITAGGDNQEVKETNGHGVFTSLFVRGLAGEADIDANGLVHFGELKSWLVPKVFRASREFKQDVQGGRVAPGAGRPVFVVPSDTTRRKFLDRLVADEIKAALLQRCADKKGDCPYGSKGGNGKPAPVVGPATKLSRDDAEVTFFKAIESSKNPDYFRAYLNKFPNGIYAGLARLKIEDLEQPRTASRPAPVKTGRTEMAAVIPPKAAAPKPVTPAVGIYASRKPGTVFRDCDDCPEMVVIPPGTFRMGDLQGGGVDDEKPVHDVQIDYSFAVGKYEVTWAEWEACVRGGGCDASGPEKRGGDEGWGRGRRPVINVSWDDAKAYVAWLSRTTGKGYRLLSEAEWEYVARAGSSSKYSFGSDESQLCAHGNGADKSTDYDWRNESCNDGYGKQTAPVGRFRANPFGLHDVHGNVWEWVEDCWHESYEDAPTDGSAWDTGGDCSRRVLRGGAWVNLPRYLRAALRYRSGAGGRHYSYGFRLARTLSR